MIPISLIEEHNEAFLSWHQFIQQGIIPPKGNYLLHVDHHDDLSTGGYRFNPNEVPTNLAAIEKITYHDLGIANFIWPAVHEGVFSSVHVVKNRIPYPVETQEMVTICKDGVEILPQNYIPLIHAEKKQEKATGYSFFTKIENGLGTVHIDPARVPECGYVLDLDLDYFCWDDSLSTRYPKRIEITEKAYQEFWEDKYHPFRILPLAMIQAVVDDGKYYLEYKEDILPSPETTEERMQKRVDTLMAWLKEQTVRPAAIDICTSRFSGYLPSYAYPFIKDTVLDALKILDT